MGLPRGKFHANKYKGPEVEMPFELNRNRALWVQQRDVIGEVARPALWI